MRGRKRQSPYLYKPRVNKDSRTIPLFDETDQDNGTYYRCWHCGFICNDRRDTLGGESTSNRVTHSDFSMDSVPEPGIYGIGIGNELTAGGLASVNMNISGIHHDLTLVKSDSNGNPVEPKHYHDVSTSGGCPFCGSANYRGDY